MVMRAVRGATQVDADEREHVLERTKELVEAVMSTNGLTAKDVVSVFFTATRDVESVAPALAARQWGMTEVALICVQEMYVSGSLPRVVRLLAHVDGDVLAAPVQNVYLHGTEVLRGDAARAATAMS